MIGDATAPAQEPTACGKEALPMAEYAGNCRAVGVASAELRAQCARVLEQFIQSNRAAIIARTHAHLALRVGERTSDTDLQNGIPLFLNQLCEALIRAQSTSEVDHVEIGKSAAKHGLDLLRRGLSIGQVVHVYGDVCQSITALAVDHHQPIAGDELRTMNLCIDDAIAAAVTEFSQGREHSIVRDGTRHLGFLAHEMRNLLHAAMLSFESIEGDMVAADGSTALAHGRSLIGLRDLVERSLAEVRLDAGVKHLTHICVAELVEEVAVGATLQASARGVELAVQSVDRLIAIEGDRQVLAAALSNILQNAFKFTHKQTRVVFRAIAAVDRVQFEIEDKCGGIPGGKVDELFLPFTQAGHDRSGVGLGLAICVKAAHMHGGEIRVRDFPGEGCIFTLDLPRKAATTLPAVDGGMPESTSQVS